MTKIETAVYALRAWLLRQQWFTSTVLPSIPRPARWLLRRLYFLPSDLIDRMLGHREEMFPPKSEIFTGSVDDFKRSGQALVRRLVDLAGLTPDSTVLDVGAGMGRLAVALTPYLKGGGCYEGMEIVPSGIKWCNDNITSRFPNFRFTLADIYNKEYNPNGRNQGHRIPVPIRGWNLRSRPVDLRLHAHASSRHRALHRGDLPGAQGRRALLRDLQPNR